LFINGLAILSPTLTYLRGPRTPEGSGAKLPEELSGGWVKKGVLNDLRPCPGVLIAPCRLLYGGHLAMAGVH